MFGFQPTMTIRLDSQPDWQPSLQGLLLCYGAQALRMRKELMCVAREHRAIEHRAIEQLPRDVCNSSRDVTPLLRDVTAAILRCFA